MLSFRGLWNASEPRIADINKIKRKIEKIPAGSILRLGGMTDCFQPFESHHRITHQTIKALNEAEIGYLIVTKSHMVAEPEYTEILHKDLAHVQISVTCLDDNQALEYEKASTPTKRIQAIHKLQALGFDVSIRLSPLIEEFMDFPKLNALKIEKCIVEFLRINSWIKQWMSGVDFSKYNLRHGGYLHLPLEEKMRIVNMIDIPGITICDDVTEHYLYWRDHFNPNPSDCCNLQLP